MQAYDLQECEDFLKNGRIVPERNRSWCVRWVERSSRTWRWPGGE